jgi:hypothetical protein
VLNLHLRQHSVRKVKHNALMAKVKVLEAELTTVRDIAGKALTMAYKTKT